MKEPCLSLLNYRHELPSAPSLVFLLPLLLSPLQSIGSRWDNLVKFQCVLRCKEVLFSSAFSAVAVHQGLSYTGREKDWGGWHCNPRQWSGRNTACIEVIIQGAYMATAFPFWSVGSFWGSFQAVSRQCPTLLVFRSHRPGPGSYMHIHTHTINQNTSAALARRTGSWR